MADNSKQSCDLASNPRVSISAEGSELMMELFNHMPVEALQSVPHQIAKRIGDFMVANGYRIVFDRWYLQADPKGPERSADETNGRQRHVLEEIRDHSTDKWAAGLARGAIGPSTQDRLAKIEHWEKTGQITPHEATNMRSAVEPARELSASESASFAKTLARSPRRVEPECQHDMLKPKTTIVVDPNDPFHASCSACKHDFRTRAPLETSSDGWKCVTCGHENPRGTLRCQNSQCTALSYSPENGEPEHG